MESLGSAIPAVFSGSSMLRALHNKFSELVSSQAIKTLSLSEGSRTNLPFRMKEILVPPECSGEYSSRLFYSEQKARAKATSLLEFLFGNAMCCSY